MANASLKQSVTFFLADWNAWPEMREVIGLRGREGNRNRGEQDRKQRFIACIVTTLIFWASPELNPTFRLQKIYYFLYILVENRQKISKKNGKRQKKRGPGIQFLYLLPLSDQVKHFKSSADIG